MKKIKRRKNLKNMQKLYNRYKKFYSYNTVLNNEYHILTFKAFYSNFFIMLTDKKGNPLISCSTGQVAKSRSKKRKNSLTLIHPMMRKVKLVLLKHRIRNLAIHIRTDISAKVITAIKFLRNSRYKFKFPYIALVRPIPHHFGRRKRKPRRV
jgi:ribosomal protein S11